MLILVAVLLGLYLIVCALVAWKQGSLVWFPGPPPIQTPAMDGIAFDDLELKAVDGVAIHGWRLRTSGRALGAIVVCHGNAGNIAMRIPLARTFLEMGYDVVLFDYRGYGASSGAPTEEGTYLDAVAAWDWAHAAGFEPGRIVAYGESLGGAVAIELAGRREVGALIVEDTFTSLADMGGRVYPWLPVRLILRIRYDSIRKIGKLEVPTLVIHSRADDLVPFDMGEQLFRAATGPKLFIETGGAHSGGGFTTRGEWRAAVRTFLETALAPGRNGPESHRAK
jgi:fermentation-respiration switch protein FrsA (DUF1100 family)